MSKFLVPIFIRLPKKVAVVAQSTIQNPPEGPGNGRLQADNLIHAQDYELHSTPVADGTRSYDGPVNCVPLNALSSSSWPKLLVISAADKDKLRCERLLCHCSWSFTRRNQALNFCTTSFIP
jgi:hypothetical protein